MSEGVRATAQILELFRKSQKLFGLRAICRVCIETFLRNCGLITDFRIRERAPALPPAHAPLSFMKLDTFSPINYDVTMFFCQ